MDCVSAAISSMFPEAASEKTINKLIAEGYQHEGVMLRRLNLIRCHVDNGGVTVGTKSKRKAGGTTENRPKRSRFRLHRTSVSKRVRKLTDGVLKKKAEYLSNCKFVGLIIDEGNNFARRCPLYAATISCDAEFNFRIQFIGQADCEGHKDGESIDKLVKEIFVHVGLEEVWKRICCAGTDGASVMRSTQNYTGK